VKFSGSGSYDPDGTISAYSWSFGDTGWAGTSAATHAYAAKGVYSAVLTVTDNAGFSETANVVITVTGPPATPTGLTAAAASASQINLSWTDNSDDETGFKIERASAGGGYTQVATVGTNVRNYADTGLTPGTTYSYRVRATNSQADSPYSNETSAGTLAASPAHIGDLDGTRSVSKKVWSAKVTIAVHDASHKPVAGAVVSGAWSPGGNASCTTGTKGTCTASASGLSLEATQVTFTVGGVAKPGWMYVSAGNHDPDGSSDGTVIRILR
jgi:hypothetical protein